MTTTDSRDIAINIAKYMVNHKLSPCVQIVDKLTSIYEWNGVINEDSEYMLIIKTDHEHTENLIHILKEIHNYDTPEILVIKCDNVDKKYMSWFRSYFEDSIGE